MKTRTPKNSALTIPDLSDIVSRGLDFFQTNPPRRLQLKNRRLRFVIGSVNAYHTGRLLFANQATLFADESNFMDMLRVYRPLIKDGVIREAVIISASGEKDSIWEIREAKKAGLKTILLTCQASSTGARLANACFIFQKSPEPYSYNFSTYLGMILSSTRENPAIIKKYLSTIKTPRIFAKHDYYSFILPDRFRPIAEMLKVKDDELFGPYSSLRAYATGQARHAKFICPSDRELVISLEPNRYFGQPGHRWEIKLPPRAGAGLVLSLAYHLAGLVQKARPDHFKNNLSDYCARTGPRPYGRKKPFPLIVE